MNTRDLRFRSNRICDILQLFHEELDPLYGHGEVSTFCEMLCEAFLGWDRVRLMTSKEQTIDQSDLLRFHWALEDLKRYRPIQHIIGYTDFCGCRIHVNPDVLIPRPETAEMVEWLCRRDACAPSSILDLCTGSGCIAIALKKAFPEAEVTAVDLSSAALAVARKNADENGVEINFLQADILSPEFSILNVSQSERRVNSFTMPSQRNVNEVNSQFSILISNPPYVMERERAAMSRNVLDYDPGMALFVPDDDALRFYRAIGRIAARYLSDDGLLAVEINEQLGEETCQTLQASGLETELLRDFRGKARNIIARRKH